MEELNKIIEEIIKRFEKKDKIRERSLKLTRQAVRLSGEAIKAIHRGQSDVAESKLSDVRKILQETMEIVSDHLTPFHTRILETAQQEYVEASLLDAIVNNKKIHSPEELGVSDLSFLLGLGDVVGELRRYILDSIRSGSISEAERIFEVMDSIYYSLMSIDFPKGLIPNLRRKVDTARILLEKTHGELTGVLHREKLRSEIKKFEKRF